MKLVILAGGKGKRMGESSNHTPKPILHYKGKPLIAHNLEQVPAHIETVVIVVGHLGEKIIETIGDSYVTEAGRILSILYVWQHEQLGTAHSLLQARDILVDGPQNSPFLVIMGDDLYSRVDLEKMISHFNSTGEWSVLLEDSAKPMALGKCIVNGAGNLTAIVDDRENKIPSNNMYTGACLLTAEVFNIEMAQLSSGEFGLPYTFVKVADQRNIKAIWATFWKRITTPEDLVD